MEKAQSPLEQQAPKQQNIVSLEKPNNLGFIQPTTKISQDHQKSLENSYLKFDLHPHPISIIDDEQQINLNQMNQVFNESKIPIDRSSPNEINLFYKNRKRSFSDEEYISSDSLDINDVPELPLK